MANFKELIEELEKSKEILNDFNKIKHLFSNDDAEKSMAELRRTLGQIIFRLKASNVTEIEFPDNKPINTRGIGKLVRVRPCNEKYKNKTYLGIKLGDIALGSNMKMVDDKTIQLEYSHFNPAMYVPELDEVIYGCGSWWSEIKNEDELKEITDEDIHNTWYVKLAKELDKKHNPKTKEELKREKISSIICDYLASLKGKPFIGILRDEEDK